MGLNLHTKKDYLDEMIYIGTQKLSLNKQNDTELYLTAVFLSYNHYPLLNPPYSPFFSSSPRSKTLFTNSFTPPFLFRFQQPPTYYSTHSRFILDNNTIIIYHDSGFTYSQVFSLVLKFDFGLYFKF